APLGLRRGLGKIHASGMNHYAIRQPQHKISLDGRVRRRHDNPDAPPFGTITHWRPSVIKQVKRVDGRCQTRIVASEDYSNLFNEQSRLAVQEQRAASTTARTMSV